MVLRNFGTEAGPHGEIWWGGACERCGCYVILGGKAGERERCSGCGAVYELVLEGKLVIDSEGGSHASQNSRSANS